METNTPRMLVARDVVVGRQTVGREGRRWLVVARAVFDCQQPRQQVMEKTMVGHHLIPVPHLVLVVAAPGDESGMTGQPADLMDGLALDRVVEAFIMARVTAAREDEFLPNQDAARIAEIVEIVMLVESPTPDPEEVEVGFQGAVEQFDVTRPVDTSCNQVGGNEISALAEDAAVVDLQHKEAAAFRMR